MVNLILDIVGELFGDINLPLVKEINEMDSLIDELINSVLLCTHMVFCFKVFASNDMKE